MGNLFTYLSWRGDLSFRERPFCEVDNLMLALLWRGGSIANTLYQSGGGRGGAALGVLTGGECPVPPEFVFAW